MLAGSAITAAQHRVSTLFVVADARTAEGVRQIYGMDVYPAHDILAQTEWLRNNPENARKLAAAVMKSMRYMKEHSPEEIHRHMPAQYRIQEEGVDLDALRATVPMISQDGKVTAEEARAIKNVLAVSSEKVRNARIDLEGTYTNEYLPSLSTANSLVYVFFKSMVFSLPSGSETLSTLITASTPAGRTFHQEENSARKHVELP